MNATSPTSYAFSPLQADSAPLSSESAPPPAHIPAPEAAKPPSRNAAPPPKSPPLRRAPPSTPSPKAPPSNSSPSESSPPGDSPSSPPSDYSTPPPRRSRGNNSPSPSPAPPPDSSTNATQVTPSPHKVPTSPSPPSQPPPVNHSDVSQFSSGRSDEMNTGVAVGIGMAVTVTVLIIAMVVCFSRKKKRYKGGYPGDYQNPSPLSSVQVSGNSTPTSKNPSVPLMMSNNNTNGHAYSPQESMMGNSKSWFTYEELSEATNGFSNLNILGEGGFGCVYKGFLHDRREVAVKQLKVGGAQGEREFQAEVEIISRVHHRHLVSLVGYCISEKQRLLVYDYVPNNTLHHHLHGRGVPGMNWEARVKVAAGAARGLAYLHEDCHPRIIHRDIKSSNILLDTNFEALVADFGLAKLTADTNTHVSTRVMGTFGYLAPEYASSGKLTDRSDVFSYGVVLLEIITGRRPVDSSQPLGDESLVDWARPLMITALETGKFGELPDPKLQGNYNEREMFQMIEAASACVRYNAQMRPRMGRVVRVLDSLVDSMDNLDNGVKPGQTMILNGPSSAEDLKNFHKMAFASQDYSSDFSRGNTRL